MTNRKILIVSGELPASTEVEGQLTRLGYEVAGVASPGKDAITKTAGTAPDLVLMDMPLRGDMNRLGGANELLRNAKLPMVLMIAEGDEASLEQAQLAGPYVYVVKPCSDRELRANIELALCKPGAARASELEDRFFENAIDMLCFLDFNGHFKRLNPAWERTLGYTLQELKARPFIDFVHPDDRERTLAQNAKVRAGGQALSFENRYLCKDGSFRWFRWNAAPDSPQKVIYSVARDVTDSKRAEEEREKLVRELQAVLVEVKTLQAILPICSYCRKIRDDGNYWHTVEDYISEHTTSLFSHSICPSCMATHVEPQLKKLGR